MCLRIQHHKLAEDGVVITKPITCWKVMKKIKPVWYLKWFREPEYISPFRKTKYEMNETVTLHSTVRARPRFHQVENITPSGLTISQLEVSHWEVDYGIHSFIKFEDAQNAKDELELSHEPHGRKSWTIVECEIPTGSTVFEGLWQDGGGDEYKSYASSAITMKEDADYEFDWADIFSVLEKN